MIVRKLKTMLSRQDKLVVRQVGNFSRKNLLMIFKAKGFQVFITADHGNIEAKGLGNLTQKDKVGSLSRGKRHMHFTNETLMNGFLEQNENLDLGKKGLSVYLKHKEAFTTENSQVVTHGGSHFWEVIVPFISLDEK